MIVAQLLVLTIGLIVYMMQHKLKKKVSIVASKLIYWTTLLFVSVVFNSMLFASYSTYYRIEDYFTIESLIVVGGILLIYAIIQLLAPAQYIKKLTNKFSKEKEDTGKEDEANEKESLEKDSYIKEHHFEIFLETVCWLGFVAALIVGIYTNLTEGLGALANTGLTSIVCLMMMTTVPIIIRQIIFYLYRIRGIKEEQNLAEVEQKFHHRLKKQNTKL